MDANLRKIDAAFAKLGFVADTLPEGETKSAPEHAEHAHGRHGHKGGK